MITPIDESVGIDGVRFHARLEGPDGAPGVVLVHSLGTNLKLWDAQIPALVRQYRVLRYDMRGHGGSEAPRGPYTVDLLADDLISLVRYFEIEDAHVVGVSLGALTALAVGLRNEPEVRSIAVCNTRADVAPEFAAAIDARNALIRARGIAAIADTQPAHWLAPSTLSRRPDLTDKVRVMLREVSPEGFEACAEAIKTNTLADHFGAIKLPTLIVASDLDGGFPVEGMRAMQQQIPDSAFSEIRDAGRLANLEQPEAFNAVLLGFLARVNRQR